MSAPRVLVIINDIESLPKRLTPWLQEEGLELVEVTGPKGEQLPSTLDGFDGLVLLGGGLLPDEDENGAWLPAERVLAQQAIDADLPTLGICLGGQLLAHVGGGEVRANFGNPENGAVIITPTAAGRADELIGTLGEAAPMIQHHRDQITKLPPAATLLATSELVTNQAFRMGENVIGLQFHPEANNDNVRNWNAESLAKQGFDKDELIRIADAANEENTAASRALFAGFAEKVRRRAGAAAEAVAAPEREDLTREVAERLIGEVMTEEVRKLSPDALAAVVTPAGEVFARAFGSASEGTVFRIASMSKSFLAATALALRDEGQIDLAAPLAIYLPDLELRHAGEPQTVTLAQSLSNRGGLPEDNSWGDRHLGLTRDELLALVAPGLNLSALPGTIYQYSNLGQALVALAIETVTGEPIETTVRQRFLDPLGLTDTAYDPAELDGRNLAKGARTFDDGETFSDEPYVGAGALGSIGGLFSTAADVAVWMRFLQSAFTPEPLHPELLSAASRREMQQGITPAPLSAGQAEDLASRAYGYGLVIDQDRDFGHIVQHSGGLPGFSSHMRWHPVTGIGVIVFGNSDQFAAASRATELLRKVLQTVDAPNTPTLWPEAVDAAVRFDEYLRAGGDFTDADAFARAVPAAAANLLPDVPLAERAKELRELLEQHGAVAADQSWIGERFVSRNDAAEARFTLLTESGKELTAVMQLTPLTPPEVQFLHVWGPRAEEPAPADPEATPTGEEAEQPEAAQ